ncbi:MAG: Rid family hydrolase [Sedimentisphaerales bacterium]|jgi:enamine deaminase RidA (YjgF/YER057c/UK114 family)
MAVKIETRNVRGPLATEIYISATLENCAPAKDKLLEMFAGIRKILTEERASILEERIFTVDGTLPVVSAARTEAYGEIDDGVVPSVLTGRESRRGHTVGVQVHAVAIVDKPEVVRIDGRACGRVIRTSGGVYLTLSGIPGGKSGERLDRAIAMFEKAESALKQYGSDFRTVSRTWMWLGDILSWYGEFNKARNQFFEKRGLIGKSIRQSMPASTGIGLGLGGDGRFGMDMTAVLEPAGSVELLAAIGRQQCALDYGSAFSRSSRASSPAGKTVFISGTASIDVKGNTTHIGDAKGQIATTIENVRAVLHDMNCQDRDVVQVVAYCKTAEVEGVFEEFRRQLDWPWITTIGDICRDDLLFEIEAAAMPQAGR